MRPRHKAAENAARLRTEADELVRASMRPRHKAAENISKADTWATGLVGLQ